MRWCASAARCCYPAADAAETEPHPAAPEPGEHSEAPAQSDEDPTVRQEVKKKAFGGSSLLGWIADAATVARQMASRAATVMMVRQPLRPHIPGAPAAQRNHRIMQAQTVGEVLQEVLPADQPFLNNVNIATAFSRLAGSN